jgi:hypothetical protein
VTPLQVPSNSEVAIDALRSFSKFFPQGIWPKTKTTFRDAVAAYWNSRKAEYWSPFDTDKKQIKKMAKMLLTEWSQRGLCHGKGSNKNNFGWNQKVIAAMLLSNAVPLALVTRSASVTTIIPSATKNLMGAATVMPSMGSVSLAERVAAAESASFRLASGELVEFVQSIVRLRQLIARHAELRGDVDCIVAVDCEGVPESLHLIQLAFTSNERAGCVIVLDGVKLGELEMCQLLAPLFSSELALKMFHDLHMDAAALATIGGIRLANCIDAQLVMELLHGTLCMGFNGMLQKLGHFAHPSKFAVKQQMKASNGSIFSRRPLPRELVEYAAIDAALLLSVKDSLLGALEAAQRENIRQASNIRAQHAAASGGRRRICADLSNDYALASRELMQVFRPESMQAIEPLVVSNEIDPLLSLLPADIASSLDGHEEHLSDIQLDKGRRPLAWSAESERV